MTDRRTTRGQVRRRDEFGLYIRLFKIYIPSSLYQSEWPSGEQIFKDKLRALV
jgi:hypothetical protein